MFNGDLVSVFKNEKRVVNGWWWRVHNSVNALDAIELDT